MARDDDPIPDWPPERCTYRSTLLEHWRCPNDADDAYTFDTGQTRLCTEHGQAREVEEGAERAQEIASDPHDREGFTE